MDEIGWCRDCGQGIPPGMRGPFCPDCKPAGNRPRVTETTVPCEECNGSGRIYQREAGLWAGSGRECQTCHGRGSIPAEEASW